MRSYSPADRSIALALPRRWPATDVARRVGNCCRAHCRSTLLVVEVRATILGGGKGITVLSVLLKKVVMALKVRQNRASYISEVFMYERGLGGILFGVINLPYEYLYEY